MGSPAPEFEFELSGGRLCLDFANTLNGRLDPPEIDRLAGYDDFVAFARQSSAVSDAEAAALRRSAAERPKQARATLARARELREALFRLFFALAHDRAPSPTDLGVLNEKLSVLGRLRIAASDDGYRWEWDRDRLPLDAPLWPIIRDAAELLVSAERTSLRECAAGDCAWLFVDHSKNQSRRWCDMKICGNRTKVRRHYLKTRGRS